MQLRLLLMILMQVRMKVMAMHRCCRDARLYEVAFRNATYDYGPSRAVALHDSGQGKGAVVPGF